MADVAVAEKPVTSAVESGVPMPPAVESPVTPAQSVATDLEQDIGNPEDLHVEIENVAGGEEINPDGARLVTDEERKRIEEGDAVDNEGNQESTEEEVTSQVDENSGGKKDVEENAVNPEDDEENTESEPDPPKIDPDPADAKDFRDSEYEIDDGRCPACGAPGEAGTKCLYCGVGLKAKEVDSRDDNGEAPQWFKDFSDATNQRMEEMRDRIDKLNTDPKTGENIDEAMAKTASDPEMVEIGRAILKSVETGDWDISVLQRIGRKMVSANGEEMTDEQITEFMSMVIRPDRLMGKWSKRMREQEKAKKSIMKLKALEARAAMVPEMVKDLRDKKEAAVDEARRLESGINFKDPSNVAERNKWYSKMMEIAGINEQLIATRHSVTILKAEFYQTKMKLHDDLSMGNPWIAVVDAVQAAGYTLWANINIGIDSAIAFSI